MGKVQELVVPTKIIRLSLDGYTFRQSQNNVCIVESRGHVIRNDLQDNMANGLLSGGHEKSVTGIINALMGLVVFVPVGGDFHDGVVVYDGSKRHT